MSIVADSTVIATVQTVFQGLQELLSRQKQQARDDGDDEEERIPVPEQDASVQPGEDALDEQLSVLWELSALDEETALLLCDLNVVDLLVLFVASPLPSRLQEQAMGILANLATQSNDVILESMRMKMLDPTFASLLFTTNGRLLEEVCLSGGPLPIVCFAHTSSGLAVH
jgi:hypothetical protein